MTERTRLLPLLPLRDICIMPGTSGEALVGRKTSLRAIEQALKGERILFVATQKDSEENNPLPHDLLPIGTVSRLEARIDLADGSCRVVLSSSGRARLIARKAQKSQITTGVTEIEEPVVSRSRLQPRFRQVIEHLVKESTTGRDGRALGLLSIGRERNLGRWCDRLCPIVFPAWTDWVRILQVVNPPERAATLGAALAIDVLATRWQQSEAVLDEIARFIGDERAAALSSIAARSSTGREVRIRAIARFLLGLQEG